MFWKGASLPLTTYLGLLTQPLDASGVVTLLMPAALQLRDMHNSGLVFQNLCPACVTVTTAGCRLEKREGVPTEEFLSPERRGGAFAGVKSDIYAFCALLLHVARAAGSPAGESLTLLESAAKKGLAELPEDRYASMQELIYALSPLNGALPEAAKAPFAGKKRPGFAPLQRLLPPGPRAAGAAADTPGTADGVSTELATIVPGRKKRRWGVIAVSTLAAGLIVAFALYVYINGSAAIKAMEELNFEKAVETYARIPFASRIDMPLTDYFNAASDTLNRKYATAIKTFGELGDFLNAKTARQEVYYRQAHYLVMHKKYDDAIGTYRFIAAYKDSAKKINETMYLKACDQIEQGEYAAAEEVLTVLYQGGYAEAGAKLAEIEQSRADRYAEAVGQYESWNNDAARAIFTQLGDYERCKDYLVLLDAREGNNLSGISYDLMCLIGFEDANELIMKYDSTAKEFLTGDWRGGGHYFRMSEDGHTHYDLPWFNYGDYYRIEDGLVLLFPEENSNDTRALFYISIVDYDTIWIFAYKNDTSYKLTRQC